MGQFNNIARQGINRVRDLFQMQWSRKSFKQRPKSARPEHGKQKLFLCRKKKVSAEILRQLIDQCDLDSEGSSACLSQKARGRISQD